MGAAGSGRDRGEGGWQGRFEGIYAAHYRAIKAYALRRTADPEDAADVVAETFLIVWRRLDRVPEGTETLLWLYGVARNVLANQARGQRRRERLVARLRAHERPEDDRSDGYPAAGGVAAALDRLTSDDRELLLLTAVEGLTPAQVATVVGSPAVTVRVRLHRARARLARELARDGIEVKRGRSGGHEPVARPVGEGDEPW